jgi:hypothetical protein
MIRDKHLWMQWSFMRWVTGMAEDWESEGEEFGFEGIDSDTSATDSD